MVFSWERANINLTIHTHHFHIGTFSLVTKRQVKFNSSFLFPWGELKFLGQVHLVYVLLFTQSSFN